MPLSNLKPSTLYLREYVYTTLNGYDIEYRALSYKELDNIQHKYINKSNTSYINIVKTSLLHIEDFPILIFKDIELLYKSILKVSTVSSKDITDLSNAVEIIFDDTFKDESFRSCAICQAKRLDTQRNCPLLDKSTHDSMVFYIIGNKKESICPMDAVSKTDVSDALTAYNMYEAGLLPSVGGLYDQPLFFIEASSLVRGIVNAKQSAAMEK